MAFTVADEYQHRGAATLLLRQLVGIARERGIREFAALVLDGNRPMLKILKNSGLPSRMTFMDGVRRVVMTLNDPRVSDPVPDPPTQAELRASRRDI